MKVRIQYVIAYDTNSDQISWSSDMPSYAEVIVQYLYPTLLCHKIIANN